MCGTEILVVSNFDLLSKCCKRICNSRSLSIENNWPVNWASVTLLSVPSTILSSVFQLQLNFETVQVKEHS